MLMLSSLSHFTNNGINVSSVVCLLLNSVSAAYNSKRIKPRIRFSAETKWHKLVYKILDIYFLTIHNIRKIYLNLWLKNVILY